MGKVPALKHGDTVITEVAAICTYLADEFPAAKLNIPVGTPRAASTSNGCSSGRAFRAGDDRPRGSRARRSARRAMLGYARFRLPP